MKKSAQTPYSNRGFDAQILSIVPYNDPLVLDGVIASIDSVRIKYTYSKTAYDFDAGKRCDTLDKLLYVLTSESLWLTGGFDIDAGREYGFKIGNYMRTITYKLLNGNSFSVLVGRYCYDSSVRLLAPEIVLDVNPNKIPPEIWHRIASILSVTAREIEIIRFDLAVDLPVRRNQFQLMQRSGSGYEKFVSKAGAVTEYTGDRSHHAAVKLYDKGADLGVPDLACTRCELTIDPARFKGIARHWPTILSLAPVGLDMDFDKMPYEVKSVILCPELLPVLKSSTNRNTFAKYHKMIQACEKTYFTLTDDQTAAIDRYILDYLAKLKTAGKVK